MTRGRLAVMTLLMAALLLAVPAELLAQRKSSWTSRYLKRRAEARKKAEHLERQADGARAKLLRTERQLRRLDPQAVKAAKRHLKNVTEGILAAQDKDSPFARARRYYDEASRAYRLAREQAYESPQYKAAYRRALAGENRASAVTKLRRETIESDRVVRQARLASKIAEIEYYRLRDPILDASKERRAAIDILRNVKEEQKKIAEHNVAVRIHKLSAADKLFKAEAASKKLEEVRRRPRRR